MGHKSSPYALRLGIGKSQQLWNSSYLAPRKEQVNWLKQDKLIRDFFYSHSEDIVQLRIERAAAELIIFLRATNTNLIAGENNKNFELILQKIRAIIDNKKTTVKFHLIEEEKIYSSAQAIANLLAQQIRERVSFRLAIRNILNKVNYQREVKGIKIRINGRLNGSDIANHELISQGKMPLSTLVLGNNKIDYAQKEAKTSYGQIGITVWIYVYQGEERKRRYVNPKKDKI